MDRSGADFYETVQQMKDILGANPCPVQIPIGAEENFKGVIDLIKMKAILWHDETMGAEYSIEEIPADLLDEAKEWHDKMIENAANYDDALMEKYLEGVEPSEEELIAAIRKATISMDLTPMVLGSSYKNKGVQPLLDYVCAFLPSPLDTVAIVGVNPNTDEEGDDRGKPCDLQRDEQRGKCFIGHYLTVNPYFSKTLAALSVWRKARNSFAAISFLESFSTAAG